MTLRDHLRGVLVAAVAFCALVLGMPGLDLLGPQRWAPGSRAREQVLQELWGPIAVAAADVNRTVRMPIVEVLAPVQRPLRLAQSWGLYGGGAERYRVFEIHVDDRLVHRSNDPEANWLEGELRYRRIRPVVDAHCHGVSKNSRGLLRYVLRRVREDFPEAHGMVVQCVHRPRHAEGPVEVTFRRVATAPGWTLRP